MQADGWTVVVESMVANRAHQQLLYQINKSDKKTTLLIPSIESTHLTKVTFTWPTV